MSRFSHSVSVSLFVIVVDAFMEFIISHYRSLFVATTLNEAAADAASKAETCHARN
jgi:hypothetical protein